MTKTGRRRTRQSRGGDGGPEIENPSGEGGADEAASLIAETVADLAQLARRHRLDLLARLLEMARMEATDRVQLRGKRKLS